MLLQHMHKKFEINRIKIKGGCQSVRKAVTHSSKSDLPLVTLLKEGVNLDQKRASVSDGA